MTNKLTVNELKTLAKRTKLSAKFIVTSGVTGPRLKELHKETSKQSFRKKGLTAMFGIAAAAGAGMAYSGFSASPVWWDTMAVGAAGAGTLLFSSIAFLLSLSRPANYSKAQGEIINAAESKNFKNVRIISRT